MKPYFIVMCLCLINLINYMDRFTIAGVLKEIQDYFNIGTTTSGLLQTAFICSYMVFAPIFGVLGDRYPRKIIIVGGVFFWSATTFMSSFVQKNHTAYFFLFRALVGIGEASYSTVAPTIIADLFIGKQRSTMIALFYFAIPVGSGLGYIVGTTMSNLFGSWKWALRFTPAFGVVLATAFIFVKEPKRGAIEGANYERNNPIVSDTPFSLREAIKSLKDDFISLMSVPSFIFTTLGFTCVCFSTGALSWWSPYFMEHAIVGSTADEIGFRFGVIACVGGIIGVLIGSLSSQKYRPLYPKIDPYICAIGVFLSIPAVFLSVAMARQSSTLAWFSIFFAITFLSTNWSVVVDILLYVIVPNKRSTAQSVQIMISHILGDATSPFIIGAMADAFAKNSTDNDAKYTSLAYSLYLTPFVLIFGGISFLVSARYVLEDEKKCKILVAGSDPSLSNNVEQNGPDLHVTGSFGNESTNNLITNCLDNSKID